jgi:glycosyltransferase involved in cell wall biosynthesis
LAKRNVDIVVAASGSKDDPREPDYFDGIMRQVEEHGLGRSFRYLGMIPLPHVYALLRASTALINPSRFEGWSTTVEEAKAFGVPTILSDIGVHREQAGGSARYFGVDDPEMLAGHLSQAAQNPENPAVRNLLPNLDLRVEAFAADFALAVQGAIEFAREKQRP